MKTKRRFWSEAQPVGLQGCRRKPIPSEVGNLARSISDDSLAISLTDGKAPDSKTLKEQFLQCFGVRTDNTAVLQGVVRSLIDQGVPRQTLVKWAVEAGYRKSYVSSLLSRIFVSLGMRERKPGAGRKPSAMALELLAIARSRYGEHFLKVLRGAWRAGKAQCALANKPNKTNSQTSGLIVVPQLEEMEQDGQSETMTMNCIV